MEKRKARAKKKVVVPVVVKTPPHAAIFDGLQAGGATIRHPKGAEYDNIRRGIVPNKFSVIATVSSVSGAIINIDYCNIRKKAEIRFRKDGMLIALTAMPFCGNSAIALEDPEVIKNTLRSLADGSIWADECQRAANPPITSAVLP